MMIGEMNKAKSDFKKALDLSGGKDQEVIKALHELKDKEELHMQRQKEFTQNMLKPRPESGQGQKEHPKKQVASSKGNEELLAYPEE